MLMGPESTLYEGGFFKAKLKFPSDFPNMPPEMIFVSEMWHPNVYEGGKVGGEGEEEGREALLIPMMEIYLWMSSI